MSVLDCQGAGYHDEVYLDLAALALPTSLPRLGVWAASTDHGEVQSANPSDRHVMDMGGGQYTVGGEYSQVLRNTKLH